MIIVDKWKDNIYSIAQMSFSSHPSGKVIDSTMQNLTAPGLVGSTFPSSITYPLKTTKKEKQMHP